MPILRSNQPPSVEVNAALARTLWQWLVLGALAVALLPAARGYSEYVGFVPFWLLMAPAVALLTLYRDALTAAWRARLVLATPRRRRRSAAARRPGRGRRVTAPAAARAGSA